MYLYRRILLLLLLFLRPGLATLPRLDSNSCLVSCLILLSSEMTVLSHHTWLSHQKKTWRNLRCVLMRDVHLKSWHTVRDQLYNQLLGNANHEGSCQAHVGRGQKMRGTGRGQEFLCKKTPNDPIKVTHLAISQNSRNMEQNHPQCKLWALVNMLTLPHQF